MKNRLLIVSIHGLGLGGIGVHICQYMKDFPGKQWQVDIINDDAKADQLPEELKSYGCRIINVRSRKMYILGYIRDLCAIFLSQNKKGNPYTIVHIHGNSQTMALELMLAKHFNVPVRIAHCHNMDALPLGVMNKMFRALMGILFYKAYTHGFACSREAGAWLFKSHPFTVLPNCINLERFAFNPDVRREIRTAYDIGDSTLVIGHVGHVSAQKNQGFLIDTASALPRDMDFTVWLIGEGTSRGKCEAKALASGVGEKIRFLGRQDASRFLQAIDVFVLPSKWESFCISLLEAQAAGCVCMASEIVEAVTVTVTVTYHALTDTLPWVAALDKARIPLDSLTRQRRSAAAIKEIALRGYAAKGASANLKKQYLMMMEESCV